MIALETGLLALVVLVVLLVILHRSYIPSQVRRELFAFTDAVEALDHVVGKLETFHDDYWHSLETGGYPDLIRIRNGLLQSLELARDQARRYDAVALDELLRFIWRESGHGEPPPAVQEAFGDNLGALAGWRVQTRHIVEGVCERMFRSSKAYEEVGRQRSTQRAPTSLMLGELRALLEIL